MFGNKVLKGVLLVGLGATSYGMLATFVKLAYADTSSQGLHYTPAEVITAQFVIGIFLIFLINLFQKNRKGNNVVKASSIIALVLSDGFPVVVISYM